MSKLKILGLTLLFSSTVAHSVELKQVYSLDLQTANSNPDAKNLTNVSKLLLLGGGLPIRYQNQVVGAIGVAGAGGAKNDDYCATSAIQILKNL
ncbi:heme-binding protein [Acinetobacter modestus]|uniref:Heme-binding protein n=1 Tax=Acinetobacter modestus TaxID=1776740 RepID=A0ABP2TWX4_9GAMM|nr:heme-binding protein [Acinetobacter modestus]ENU26798.1 hypothetical protein F992_02347 [Acinetobacter modestus]